MSQSPFTLYFALVRDKPILSCPVHVHSKCWKHHWLSTWFGSLYLLLALHPRFNLRVTYLTSAGELLCPWLLSPDCSFSFHIGTFSGYLWDWEGCVCMYHSGYFIFSLESVRSCSPYKTWQQLQFSSASLLIGLIISHHFLEFPEICVAVSYLLPD